LSEIEGAGETARVAADHFLVRALPVAAAPAATPRRSLPVVADVSQTGGVLKRSDGCLRFIPLVSGAQLSLRVPVGGLWLRPAAGSPVPIAVDRFADTFDVTVAAVLGGRASIFRLPPSRVSNGWHAQFVPAQPLLICGA
jgi:hypothetical protein